MRKFRWDERKGTMEENVGGTWVHLVDYRQVEDAFEEEFNKVTDLMTSLALERLRTKDLEAKLQMAEARIHVLNGCMDEDRQFAEWSLGDEFERKIDEWEELDD